MQRTTLWPGIVCALIGLNMCIVAVTVVLAHSDRSLAVEPDYYQKALRWENTQRQREVNRSLGWEVRIEHSGPGTTPSVSVIITDRDGRPVEGAGVGVTAFHNARPADRSERALSETAPVSVAG